LQKYKRKHPSESIKFGLYKEKYLHVTERSDEVDRHQGGDFLQEDALGRVVTFLKTGQIFSQESFQFAVRKCQLYQISEREKGNYGSTSSSRRPKYSTEIQAMAALVLDKNENPNEKDDLGEFHKDILSLSKVGMSNYEIFFKRKIKSIPTGSIKLKPAFILKEDCEEYDKIENKTKEEIKANIVSMVAQVEFDDENEKTYFETKTGRTNTRKDELVEIYYEIKTKLILFSSEM